MNSLLILTGHTRGLGKAVLDKFLSLENFKVVAISRSGLGRKNKLLTEIELDLSDLNALEDKVPQFFPEGKFEKVILINNAGWIGEMKPVGKLDPQAIQKAINLNLLSPMILTDAFVKVFANHQGEKIICNISSGAAHKPLAGWAEYCTSKAGLAMFSKVSSEDLKDSGFRVFSLAPGIVDTEMQADIRKANESDFPALERFIGYKSNGKLTSANVVAEKVYYLLNNPDLFKEVLQDVRNFELP